MKKLVRFFSYGIILMLIFLLPVPVSAKTTAPTNPTYLSNWAGYVALNSTYTSVSAQWTVPTVTDTTSPAYSSVWAGIGGFYVGSKLIQAGTEQDVNSDGSTSYSAWYEVFPHAPVNYLNAVNPGDQITLTISQESKMGWHIHMKDTTQGNSVIDVHIRASVNFASLGSAEFIVERPLLVRGHQVAPLADFGSVTFSGCSTSQGGLSTLDSDGNTVEIIMTSNGKSTGDVLSYPGDISSNSFPVTYGSP